MGFLDHSTNNIIVDAVLTDTGRQVLAKNDGSFVITKFAFGDDEIDYSMITKFGLTVGKEKITKNTPIFEAQTNGNLALKNRLLSVSTPDLYVLPTLAITLDATAGSTFARATATTSGDYSFTQSVSGIATVPTDLVDSAFVVQYDNRFLSISRKASGGTSVKSVANNVATITVAADGMTGTGGGIVELIISVNSFSDDYFNVYSTGDSNTIRTQVLVSGRSSGSVVIQEFSITK